MLRKSIKLELDSKIYNLFTKNIYSQIKTVLRYFGFKHFFAHKILFSLTLVRTGLDYVLVDILGEP